MDALTPPDPFRAMLAKAGIDPDKPLYGVLLTVHQASIEARQTVVDARQAVALPPEAVQRAVERAARTGLEKASAAIVDGWRWRMLAAALAVTAVVGGVAYHVGRDVGAADSYHWTAWCGDAKHIDPKLPGGPFCLVPIH